MLPPSQHEAWFISTAHRQPDIKATLTAAERSFAALAEER
jgi:glutamate-1-semialdehyde 2,1-aminomutase